MRCSPALILVVASLAVASDFPNLSCRAARHKRMLRRARGKAGEESGLQGSGGADMEDLKDSRPAAIPAGVHELPRSDTAVLEWAWRHGVSKNMPVRPAFCAQSGCRGMVAVRDIAEGEIILSIPRRLFMCADTALECPAVQMMMARARSARERLCERQVLALHLLLERDKGVASAWNAFIASIPASYTTLEYWSEEEVRGLQLPALVNLAHSRRAIVRSEFQQLLHLLQDVNTSLVAEKAGSGQKTSLRMERVGEVLTWEAYRWAAATVSTRSCHLAARHDLAVEFMGDSVGTLVPVLDLLNHAPDCSLAADCSYDAQVVSVEGGAGGRGGGGAYQVKAKRFYRTGQEVLIHYGPWGNAGLLEHYGFVMPSNSLDSCTILLPAPVSMATTPPGTPMAPERQIKKAKTSAGESPSLRSNGHGARKQEGQHMPMSQQAVAGVYDVVALLGKPVGGPSAASGRSQDQQMQAFELYASTTVQTAAGTGGAGESGGSGTGSEESAWGGAEVPWNVMTVLRWNALSREYDACGSAGEAAAAAARGRCLAMAACLLDADDGSPLSQDNESAAWRTLLDTLTAMLDSLPTSHAEDEAALACARAHHATGGASEHERLALSIRCEHKRILCAHVRALSVRLREACGGSGNAPAHAATG